MPFLQMRQWRLREVKCFARGCTARKQQGQDLNLELFPLEQVASGLGRVPSMWAGLMPRAALSMLGKGWKYRKGR